MAIDLCCPKNYDHEDIYKKVSDFYNNLKPCKVQRNNNNNLQGITSYILNYPNPYQNAGISFGARMPEPNQNQGIEISTFMELTGNDMYFARRPSTSASASLTTTGLPIRQFNWTPPPISSQNPFDYTVLDLDDLLPSQQNVF